MIRTPLPRAPVRIAALVALGALGACSKPADPAPQPPSVTPQAAAAPAPPPAKPMKMVCRNSQTGAKAECGTPNAVMVGLEPE